MKKPQIIPELYEALRADMLRMHEAVMDKFGIVLTEIQDNRLAIQETKHLVDRIGAHEEPLGPRSVTR